MNSPRVWPGRLGRRLLVCVLVCGFVFLPIAKCQLTGEGPLDKLRQDFVAKSKTHTFQISEIQLTGKIVAIDTSRRNLYQQLLGQNAAAREKLGGYVQSVILDDGQSQAKAACSAFEKDRQRQNSLLDPAVKLSQGETITVSATFLGAFQAGAVELLNCSVINAGATVGQNSAMSSQPASQRNPTPVQTTASGGVISATALLAEAKGDMAAFRRKYAGRPITFIGRVDWTYGNAVSAKHGVVLMGKFHEDGDVFCDFFDSDRVTGSQLSKEQVITIAGRFEANRVYFDREENIQYSHNRNVQLGSCKVVNFQADVPSDMQFAEAKPLGASSVALSGLYLRPDMQVMPGFSSRTAWYFYFFSPDGHVYADCPKNGELDHFDFATAAKKEPGATGYYRVTGNQIEFTWFGGRKPERSAFQQTKDSLTFLGAEWQRADTDTSKQRANWIVGTYSAQIGAAMANVASIHQSFYTLNANGAFTTTSTGMAGNNVGVPQANTSSSSHSSGTYTLSGTTLMLKFSDGHTEKHTVFPYGKSVFFDGAMFISR